MPTNVKCLKQMQTLLLIKMVLNVDIKHVNKSILTL